MLKSIMYEKNCFICDILFNTKRCHAVTCSPRCRQILYKLNQNYLEFANTATYPVFELTPGEINVAKESINKWGGVLDKYGNAKDIMGGLRDLECNIKVIVFRIRTLNYLEVWIEIDEDFIQKYYKYA